MTKTTKTTLILVLTIIVAVAIGFGITSGLLYGICWAFGFKFTWKLAIGVYLVLVLIKAVFFRSED